jgi:hypothetical protein
VRRRLRRVRCPHFNPRSQVFLRVAPSRAQVSSRTRDYKKEIKSAWDNNRSMATLGYCRVT